MAHIALTASEYFWWLCAGVGFLVLVGIAVAGISVYFHNRMADAFNGALTGELPSSVHSRWKPSPHRWNEDGSLHESSELDPAYAYLHAEAAAMYDSAGVGTVQSSSTRYPRSSDHPTATASGHHSYSRSHGLHVFVPDPNGAEVLDATPTAEHLVWQRAREAHGRGDIVEAVRIWNNRPQSDRAAA